MLNSHNISIFDRVKELSYTTGTGNLLLNGAVAGFSSFGSCYSNNSNLFYAVTDGVRYEVGSGVYLSGVQNELKRFPLRSSSNNNIVNFPEGIKEVYATYPATHSVYTASGIYAYNAPQTSGIAFWSTDHIINYDQDLLWDNAQKRLGIKTLHPQYAIDIGGDGTESLLRSSGVIVGSSGIYFPPANDGDSSYIGGRQVTHYEKNRLDDYAVNESLIDNLTGTSSVIELSGVANNYFLFKKQQAGHVFAGPPSGCTPPCSPGYPSFRILVSEDIPDLSDTYTSISELEDVSGILNDRMVMYWNASVAYTNLTSGILNNKIDNFYVPDGDMGDIEVSNSGTIWSINDGSVTSAKIASMAVTANKLSFSSSNVCCGRLTLQSGVAVSTSNQLSKTSIFYSPYTGNTIGLYNGTNWDIVNFTTIPLNLGTMSSGSLYDIFGYNNNGSLSLELGPAWTDSLSRSTALTVKDGILCKSGELTRRYLGTIRATTSTTTDDTLDRRYVWNASNRVERPLYYSPSPSISWTYSSDTFRKVADLNTFEISVVNGLSEEIIKLKSVMSASGNSPASYYTSIGSGNQLVPSAFSTADKAYFASSFEYSSQASFDYFAPIGFSNFYPLEKCSGTVSLNTGNNQSYFGGITGSWKC